MWNEHRSLILSKICTMVFIVGVVVVMIAAPWLVDWLLRISYNAKLEFRGLFFATLYTGGTLGLCLLYSLLRILSNIGKNLVFVHGNVVYLRRISWFCFGGAALAIASALYYLPWLMVGLAAAFMGLIVRVVKNLVQQAAVLKAESDYTI